MSAGSRFLQVDEILRLHAQLVERFGGAAGILSQGALESAIAQPRMTAFGQLLHPGLLEQAAAYLFHLVQGHPFQDGNKRIGMHAAVVFLDLNGVAVIARKDDWYLMTMAVARGELSKADIVRFLQDHTRIRKPVAERKSKR